MKAIEIRCPVLGNLLLLLLFPGRPAQVGAILKNTDVLKAESV